MTKPQAFSSVALSEGWTFKQADDTAEDPWLSVKKVPTNVHLDLIEHGKYVVKVPEIFCSCSPLS